MAYFFTINTACCEEDFFVKSNFQEAKTDKKITLDKIKNSVGAKKEKFSFFMKK